MATYTGSHEPMNKRLCRSRRQKRAIMPIHLISGPTCQRKSDNRTRPSGESCVLPIHLILELYSLLEEEDAGEAKPLRSDQKNSPAEVAFRCAADLFRTTLHLPQQMAFLRVSCRLDACQSPALLVPLREVVPHKRCNGNGHHVREQAHRGDGVVATQAAANPLCGGPPCERAVTPGAAQGGLWR
eukprot:8407445-Pyramimonas_sp.AAC.1